MVVVYNSHFRRMMIAASVTELGWLSRNYLKISLDYVRPAIYSGKINSKL